MQQKKPSWLVEHRTKNKTGKPGSWWVVVRHDGHIANGYWHDKETEAQRQCELLNKYFGG